jgi:hypothetical protein
MNRYRHGSYWERVNAEHDPVTPEELQRLGLLSNETLMTSVQDAVYEGEE